MVQLSHSYMTTGKTIALTRQTLVGKEMSQWFRNPRKESLSLISLFLHPFALKWWNWMPWSFFDCSVWSQLFYCPLSLYFFLIGEYNFFKFLIRIWYLFFPVLFVHLLYNILLVLPYIDMNPPWVYMCSPFWTPLPPPSPSYPSESSQCTSPEHPVSCIEPGLATHFTYDNLHVSMPFSHIIPPSPSPTESIRLFHTSVSFFVVSHTGLLLPSF